MLDLTQYKIDNFFIDWEYEDSIEYYERYLLSTFKINNQLYLMYWCDFEKDFYLERSLIFPCHQNDAEDYKNSKIDLKSLLLKLIDNNNGQVMIVDYNDVIQNTYQISKEKLIEIGRYLPASFNCFYDRELSKKLRKYEKFLGE